MKNKKSIEFAWNHLLAILLAILILVVLIRPHVTWVSDSGKKLFDKLTFWKIKPPEPDKNGPESKFDAFNIALRDQNKYSTNKVNLDQLKEILQPGNLKKEQILYASGGEELHLLKATVQDQSIYLLLSEKYGYISVLADTFPDDDTKIYSYMEAYRLTDYNIGRTRFYLRKVWWKTDYSLELMNQEVYCPEKDFCLPSKLKEAIEKVIGK